MQCVEVTVAANNPFQDHDRDFALSALSYAHLIANSHVLTSVIIPHALSPSNTFLFNEVDKFRAHYFLSYNMFMWLILNLI